MSKQIESGDIMCPECNATYPTKSGYNLKGDMVYTCEHCSTRFGVSIKEVIDDIYISETTCKIYKVSMLHAKNLESEDIDHNALFVNGVSIDAEVYEEPNKYESDDEKQSTYWIRIFKNGMFLEFREIRTEPSTLFKKDILIDGVNHIIIRIKIEYCKYEMHVENKIEHFKNSRRYLGNGQSREGLDLLL